MAEKVKKKDCIEIKYVARVKENGIAFDVNDEETAKKEGLYEPNASYTGTIVCIGERDVIEGLDDSLEGKEVGKSYNVDIAPEKAFGKKDAKLFRLMSLSKFKQQNMRPIPGLQVTINNQLGVIKSVSGGRVLVDFNHPLAGKEITYEVTIKRKVEDTAEIIKGYMRTLINIKDVNVEVKNSTATVELDVPESIAKELEKKIKERATGVKAVKFKGKLPQENI